MKSPLISERMDREIEWFRENEAHIPRRIVNLVKEALAVIEVQRMVINRYGEENANLIAKFYGNPDAQHDRQPREVIVQHGIHQQIEESK